MGDPVYRALLIGNSTFPADANNLQTLEGPVNDISLLRAALTDRDAGLFESDNVRILPERTSTEILVELDQFFSSARRDDVLFLYYSGHGLLNERNQLFLCTRDTRTDLLKSTSISSMAVNLMFDASAAKTTVIVLDCCHSGAFKGGAFPDTLRGAGRFVMTSCRSGQLANDADRRNRTSLFTQHLVEGITGGARDSDADGYVDLGDVFDFVSGRLRAEGRQIPQRDFSGEGDVAIARREPATKGAVAAPPPPVTAPPAPATVAPVPPAEPVVAEPVPSPPAPSPPAVRSDSKRVSPGVLVGAVLVLAALAFVGVRALSGQDETASDGDEPSVIQGVVEGNAEWTAVIELQAGQTVEIRASGDVDTATEMPGRNSGPDGIKGEEYSENNTVAGVAHGALIGKLGDNGRPILVGSHFRFTAPERGMLYLGVNDKGLANNGGRYDVTIT